MKPFGFYTELEADGEHPHKKNSTPPPLSLPEQATMYLPTQLHDLTVPADRSSRADADLTHPLSSNKVRMKQSTSQQGVSMFLAVLFVRNVS